MLKQQYTLYLENRPGILAKVANLLKKAKVNIEGISVAESTHSALVQLIVSNSAKTAAALKKAKISYTSQKVALLMMDHKPGALADIADRLAKAEVNINYIYGTAADNQSECCLVVSASDLKKVEKAME